MSTRYKSAVIRRKGDIVIAVEQLNDIRTVAINNLNRPAEYMLGRPASVLIGTTIRKIFNPDMIDDIIDRIDFSEGGDNFGTILQKYSTIALIDKDYDEIHSKFKIYSILSSNPNKLRFDILIFNEELQEQLFQIRKSFGEKFNSSRMKILSNTQLNIVLDNLRNVVCSSYLDATLVTIKLLNLELVNDDKMHDIVNSILVTLQTNLRKEDGIFYMDDTNVISLILISCTSFDSRKVVNRIRHLLHNLLSKYNIKFIAGFIDLDRVETSLQLINICQNCVDDQSKKGKESVFEIKRDNSLSELS